MKDLKNKIFITIGGFCYEKKGVIYIHVTAMSIYQ